MKKGLCSFVLLLCIFCFTSTYATEVSIDLDKVSPRVAATIIQEKQNQDKEASAEIPTAKEISDKISAVKPETVNGWVEVVGNAVNKFCTVVNIQANDLIKSPAGAIAVTLIALKYGVGTFVYKLILMPVFFIFWLLGLIVFSKNINKILKGAVEKEIINKEGVRTITREEPAVHSSDKSGAAVFATIAFFAFTCLCFFIIS